MVGCKMWINVLVAYLVDVLVGDPEIRFHPTRLIGRLVSFAEGLFYRLRNKLLGGFLVSIFTTGIVFLVIFYISRFAGMLNLPYGLNPVFIVMIYFLFCNRDMHRHAMAVYRALEQGTLESARRMVGRIVGRDTESLDRKAIIRATVETIAENTVDGFIAPLFYLTIFGLPGGFLYRTVNTLDSMLGYKNERYERFGKIPARVDDVFNYLPARINLPFLFLASGFKTGLLGVALRDGKKHPSPNSGLAEAAFAAFLGIALGGPSFYGGREHVKPWLGKNRVDNNRLEDRKLILRALFLYWVNSLLALAFFSLIMYYFNLPLSY